MANLERRFNPKPPELPSSERLRSFYEENPSFDVHKSLNFLIDEYPGTERWVVHSGAAIQLLGIKRSGDPSDIDILCRDNDMESEFGTWSGNDPRWTRYIDMKSIKHWLRGRTHDSDEQAVWRRIIDTSIMMEIGGRQFRVMNPAIIAAEKSTLAKMPMREKDFSDITALGITDEELQVATNLIRGIDIDESLALLRT